MKEQIVEIVVEELMNRAIGIRRSIEALGQAGWPDEAAAAAAAVIEYIAHGTAERRPQLRTHAIEKRMREGGGSIVPFPARGAQE